MRGLRAWLPDGYSQFFKIICVWPFGLLDYGSAMLRCKNAPPRPSPWRNPRKGRDQILPSGNLERGRTRHLSKRRTRTGTTAHLQIELFLHPSVRILHAILPRDQLGRQEMRCDSGKEEEEERAPLPFCWFANTISIFFFT